MNQNKVNFSTPDMLVLIGRFLLCVVFPPLAVFDKGCGTMLLVFLFTIFGWLPGTILAFLICIKDKNFFCKEEDQD